MNKLDKYLYKKASNIDKSPVFLSIFFVIYIFFVFYIGAWLLYAFVPEQLVLFLISYSSLLIFTYHVYSYTKFVQFIRTNDIRKRILLEKENGENITEWKYTKQEWSDFSKKRISAIRQKQLKFYSILIFTCAIIILTLELMLSLVFVSLILYFALFIKTLENVYSQNWERILRKEEISVIFSKDGIVVADLYTYPSSIDSKKLFNIKNDKRNNTIIFEYSTYLPATTDFSDDAQTNVIEFPILERYKLEINKIINKTNTFDEYIIK